MFGLIQSLSVIWLWTFLLVGTQTSICTPCEIGVLTLLSLSSFRGSSLRGCSQGAHNGDRLQLPSPRVLEVQKGSTERTAARGEVQYRAKTRKKK
jgi:hypothetical protein